MVTLCTAEVCPGKILYAPSLMGFFLLLAASHFKMLVAIRVLVFLELRSIKKIIRLLIHLPSIALTIYLWNQSLNGSFVQSQLLKRESKSEILI
jgi:hypothetical protein